MWKLVSFAVALSAFAIAIQAQDLCLQCSSTVLHPECINPDIADFNRPCPGPARNRTCFSRVDDAGNVIRGCVGQLSNETASECDSETCEICVGNDLPNGPDGCNNGLFPPNRLFCHICSGGINSTCAGIINSTMTVCPIFNAEDRCYISRPNGNFERGCMSSSNSRCLASGACHICSGQGCNYVDYSSAININSSVSLIAFALLSFLMLNK